MYDKAHSHLHHGEINGREGMFAADLDICAAARRPSGCNPSEAIRQPDGIAITRKKS
jgi:hypothetical protein